MFETGLLFVKAPLVQRAFLLGAKTLLVAAFLTPTYSYTNPKAHPSTSHCAEESRTATTARKKPQIFRKDRNIKMTSHLSRAFSHFQNLAPAPSHRPGTGALAVHHALCKAEFRISAARHTHTLRVRHRIPGRELDEHTWRARLEATRINHQGGTAEHRTAVGSKHPFLGVAYYLQAVSPHIS